MKKQILLLALAILTGLTVIAQSSWFTQNSGTTENLNGVYFTDINNGWIVGDQGTILHTGDGGYHWDTLSSQITNDLKSVFFVNENKGWAAGMDGTVLFTDDGGVIWTQQTTSTPENLDPQRATLRLLP